MLALEVYKLENIEKIRYEDMEEIQNEKKSRPYVGMKGSVLEHLRQPLDHLEWQPIYALGAP